ncbi:MAG: hypothetical protein AB7J13_12745 [Pyrinomonadaceae bacterium]
MKRVTVSLIAIVIFSVFVFAGDQYTKNVNIEPESSASFSRNFAERMKVTVQIAGGDLGSGRIIAEVYDPSGKRVASGPRGFSFNTKNVKGSYRIVVINKTRNRQQVAVSVRSTNS